MDHKGEPCRECGEMIRVYSLSGLCRKCWHKNRGSNNRHLPQEERINEAIKRHSEDLEHYHFVNVGGVQVPEHRYIIGKATGKPVPKNWIVHHLNGRKGDNRMENLVAMPKGDHDSKHLVNALKVRIRDLEQLHLPI